ncbi:hypothetical protein [Dactylosporangium sp. NPDC051484]|uniref:hypothetical protein n=1 Tax=Dactylosporangium sp. NPDC051484 TaxID=3154942 RepID=UPI00344E5CED
MRVARWVLAITAWTICAVALSAFSLGRVSAAREALIKATRPAPGVSPPASPSPSPGSPTLLRTPGGNVMAGCDKGQVRVVYLRPAAGFHIVSADRAPAPQSRVTFKTDGREVRVVVTCADGEPHAETTLG